MQRMPLMILLQPFSNFGPSVSIAAPGVAILSTYLNGGYAVDSGTSMAAPSVAAAAALIKANSTDFTPKQVKDAILNSGSTPLTPCEGGPQGYFTATPTITRNLCYSENLRKIMEQKNSYMIFILDIEFDLRNLKCYYF